MQKFHFYSPTKVVFGKEAENQTAEEIKNFGGSRVFLVYGGGSIVKSGLLERIENQLKSAGIPYILKGGVKPNPTLAFAEECRAESVEFGADFVLAVGGGSVIDTGKAIAHGTANPGKAIWDIWMGGTELVKTLPVGVVLTISAAGSETSDSAVLTNEDTGRKKGLSTNLNRPKFAIMNPELSFTLPKYQIACGVVDIMMHTMDRYFTPTKGNALTDEFAEALLRTTIKYGTIACKDPENYEAMSEIMWCGSLSHNDLTGLGAEKDFTPHKLGHELSARYDAAHGASLSVMWPAWAEFSWKKDSGRFQQFLKNVWGIEEADAEKAALLAIRKVTSYFKSLDMPVNFTDLGIGVQNQKVLEELAESATFGKTIKIGSFLPLDYAGAYEVYKIANK